MTYHFTKCDLRAKSATNLKKISNDLKGGVQSFYFSFTQVYSHQRKCFIIFESMRLEATILLFQVFLPKFFTEK
jgi:hypothetical protein